MDNNYNTEFAISDKKAKSALKKKGLALLFSGFAVIILSVVIIAVLLSVFETSKTNDILSLAVGTLFALPSVGALVAYGGAVRMITPRAELVYLKPSLTLCTLAISAVGGMGFAGGISVLVMSAFGESSKYPNRYPVFLIFTGFCIFAFIALVVLYFSLWITRKDENGKMLPARVMLFDTLRSVIALPGCISLSFVGMEVLERLFVK